MKNGQLLYTAEDLNEPTELYIRDLNSGKPSQLTQQNSAWRRDILAPGTEHILVKNASGVEIEGWVLTPADSSPPFKTILNIHGGPHGTFPRAYYEDFQELVGAGYAVAFCNPRGSNGYGNAFSSAIVGCWGEPELEDFDAFLNEIIARGIADENRLAVTGVSGGGHLSAWLIGHTDRFKAAAPEQGCLQHVLHVWRSRCRCRLDLARIGCIAP